MIANAPALIPSPTLELERPKLRGVLHSWAFFASVALGVVLATTTNAEAAVPAALYAASVAALLGTSALYHRVQWSVAGRALVRRLDHAMIFVLIVGTYTPISFVALRDHGVGMVFGGVCAASLLGFVITVGWVGAPKWLLAIIYVLVGWLGVLRVPELLAEVGMSGTLMLFLGGVLYTVGALVYALKRPNPSPRVFGYHEVFHALVIAAAAVHFAFVAFWVLPH